MFSAAYGGCGELVIKMVNKTSYNITTRHRGSIKEQTNDQITFSQPWIPGDNPNIWVEMELKKQLRNGQEHKVDIVLKQNFCLWAAGTPEIKIKGTPFQGVWNGAAIYIAEFKSPRYKPAPEQPGSISLGIVEPTQ